MLEVHDLHMRFGRVTALAGVSFAAPDGQITGLLGENGAGKTTTLNILAGLFQPDRGDIRVDGEAAAATVHRRRSVGALLDQKGLYPRLTVRENVAYFGALRGLEKRELARAVDRALALVGLESLASRRTDGFSQGERMKVALARAMVHSPRNLLLDEPTNGLDIPTARGFKAALRDMRERGVCIVFSSHILDDIRALCDTVVIISKGRIVARGMPPALCEQAGCATLEDAFIRLTGREESPCLQG
jgi:sodium transport system ATP-binding protein